MSDVFSLSPEQCAKAAAWNRDKVDPASVKVLPDAVYEDYPALRCFLEARTNTGLFEMLKDASLYAAFAQEVADVQTDAVGAAGPVDGMYGKTTRHYLLARYAEDSGWLVAGGRNPASYLAGSPLERVTFLEDPFFRLTKFSKRTKPVRFVVVHWGGRSPRNLQNYFASDDAKASSHGAVGYENDGSVIATQTIDLDNSSWHGGWINQHSVGMDIAFSPQESRADYARARGWPVEIVDNPSTRGEKRIIDIPDELAEATAWLLHEWADAMGVRPEWVNSDPSVLLSQDEVLASEGGFIMHSQFSSRKWDCAPWGAKLMEWTATVAGIRRLAGS